MRISNRDEHREGNLDEIETRTGALHSIIDGSAGAIDKCRNRAGREGWSRSIFMFSAQASTFRSGQGEEGYASRESHSSRGIMRISRLLRAFEQDVENDS